MDDPSFDIARLRSLPVPSPPSWTAGEGVPKVVASLDVAWGKIKSEEKEEEEVAVAVAVGFSVDPGGGGLGDSDAPLFVEFEPREGLLRGPFPPYEAGRLFSREGPRLLVPLMKRLIDGSAAAEEEEEEGEEEEQAGEGGRGGSDGATPKTSAAKKKKKTLFPKVDLFLVDGFGELHPERFGCASALGAAAYGAPTAGVAKTMLLLGGGASPSSEREARRGKSGGGGKRKSDSSFLCPSAPGMETWPLGDDGSGGPLAVAMRPAGREGSEEAEPPSSSSSSSSSLPSSSPPLSSSLPSSPPPLSSLPGRAAFVSAGHGVPLAAAARAVLACYDRGRRFRLPEPSRAADRLARRRLRECCAG